MKKSKKSVATGIIFLFLLPTFSYSQSSEYFALLKADALRDNGDIMSALNVVNEQLLKSNDYRLYIARGEMNLATGSLTMAEADFKGASGLRKGSGAFGLARVFAAERNAPKSLAFLDENLKSAFRVSEREIMACTYFNAIESTPEWRSFWRVERFSETEKFLAEVEYLISIGKIEETRLFVSEKKATFPPSPELTYSEALMYFNSKQYQAAINLLTSSSASVNISDVKKDKLLAENYFATGNFEQALTMISDLIAGEIPDPEVFLLRARCYSAKSDYEKSLADIDFYLTLYPFNKEALDLAGMVSIKAGDNNDALKYINRNIEANPYRKEGYSSRGEIWVATRMWEYAVSDFSMVLDIDPSDSEIWLSKGISLLNMGKKEEACHDFRQSMKLGNRKASEYVSINCIK